MIGFREIDNARKILGLDTTATLSEIKERYRNLSLKYHPDRCRDKEKRHLPDFREVQAARGHHDGQAFGYRPWPLHSQGDHGASPRSDLGRSGYRRRDQVASSFTDGLG